MSRIVRLPLLGLAEGERQLDAAQSNYLVVVRRLRQGDRFVAFDPENATESAAVLQRADARSACCVLSAPTASQRALAQNVTLIQCLGKADKTDQVVRSATALGVRRLVVVESARSVVRLGKRGPSRHQRWKAIALDAARQAERGDLPVIEGPEPLLDALRRSSAESVRGLCLTPGAESSLFDGLEGWEPSQPLAVLIGPEGGLTPEEIDVAVSLGFSQVRLGPFVLRTELAAAAVLGALLARHR